MGDGDIFMSGPTHAIFLEIRCPLAGVSSSMHDPIIPGSIASIVGIIANFSTILEIGIGVRATIHPLLKVFVTGTRG